MYCFLSAKTIKCIVHLIVLECLIRTVISNNNISLMKDSLSMNSDIDRI